MKSLFVSIGMAATILSAPLTAQTLDQKVLDAVSEYEAYYGYTAAASLYNKVYSQANGNVELRFAQYNNETTTWTLTDQYGNETTFIGTGAQADSKLATLIFDNVTQYHFQSNGSGTIRIKLLNSDGSYFHSDWIYASSTGELLSNLAEESWQEGFTAGFASGYEEGYEDGYVDGYIDGFRDGLAH